MMLVFSPDAYRRFLRPLLFRLEPETAQKLADVALSLKPVWKAASPALRTHGRRLKVNLCGIELDNPVGLAAGYDKDCAHLGPLAAMGFGYVVGGTVTLHPRPGNPKPRMLRYESEESLVNSLGFPGRGLDNAEARLSAAARSGLSCPAVVSVSGTEVDEILTCHRRLEPLAAAVEVNISSPNTAGLKVFQQKTALKDLLERINEHRAKPLFVKLPPYLHTPAPALPQAVAEGVESEDEARHNVFELIRVCLETGVSAVTVSNTRPVREPALAGGTGGLSGKALFHDTVRMVAEIKVGIGNRMAINASGGISSGADVWRVLREGAASVQLLTGLVYEGPGVVQRINRELLRIMDREGVDSLGHLGPAPLPAGRPAPEATDAGE